MSKRKPPVDPGLAEIDRWHQWFLSANEQYMRDNSYTLQSEAQRRAQVRAIADARVAELRALHAARVSAGGHK